MEYFTKEAIDKLIKQTPDGCRLILHCRNGKSHAARRKEFDVRDVSVQINPLLEVSRILNEGFYGDINIDKLGSNVVYIGTEETFKP